MSYLGWLVFGLSSLPFQVPPPDAGAKAGRALEASWRSALTREASALDALAERLSQGGDERAAAAARACRPRQNDPNGPTRFVPLPEVVPPRAGPSADLSPESQRIRAETAHTLFTLAGRAARSTPPHFRLAGECLRAVLERQPDHPEARRLLGYVPHEGGWARPYAVTQIQEGHVDHPIFGWVSKTWREHLDRGELPSPPGPRGTVRWLPAPDADRLRAGWKPPWHIYTEHFEIRTNVPLAETIRFGRRLEAFHGLFLAVMADVLGENLPLARRFHDPKLSGEPGPHKRHQVYYFATQREFVDYLAPRHGADMENSLGFYKPPRSNRGGRAPAYFFRDPNGQLPIEANLYHEVSHQLLFETAGRNAYTMNAGNYWVFEGLGTYFETVETRPDGSLEVGGLVGRRIEEAIKSLVDEGLGTPIEQFVAFDEGRFMRADRARYVRYQQAAALTVFLMQWRAGTYRPGFFEYVRDAYRGRIKRHSGRTLQDRLDQPYETLDAQFLAFLRENRGQSDGPAPHADRPPASEPRPKPADSTSAIRTVPE